MTTTAVSFRKGNTEENDSFAGVTGEIVADLGANEQVTENATIVLHTGNGVAGGIRMARADFNNITNESISNLANFRQDSGQGTYYGLLRRNMSNYMTNDVNAATVEPVLKADYNIASRDGSDINTAQLLGVIDYHVYDNTGPTDREVGGKYLLARDLINLHADGENIVRRLSYTYWLNNINTSFLAEGSYTYDGQTYNPQGSLLAYANMSNVNTENLATGSGQPGEHSGKNLAYSDLTNVGYSTIVNYVNTAYSEGYKLTDYEWVVNKTNIINPYDESDLSVKYPSVQAIIDYNSSLSEDFANRSLDNINSWTPASAKQNYYKIKVSITDGGSGYAIGTDSPITTNIQRPDYDPNVDDPSNRYVKIVINRVSSTGEILEASIYEPHKYSQGYIADSGYIEPNKNGSFIVSSEEVIAGKLMRDDFSNSEISNSTNSQNASISYETTKDANTQAIVSVDGIIGILTDTGTNTEASFSTERESIGNVSKLSASNMTTQKTTSITVSKNNAYLNKDVDNEAFGAGQQLLNRNEMDARYQLQPASATQDNIATFDGSKSTIDSGKTFTTTVAPAISNTSNNKIPTEYAVREAIEDAVTRAVVYKGTVATENDLPSSGQTNGDLYWIQAFSNNPPQGMTPGHGGTAIWNANYATPAWDFKEDTINDPDNRTIQKNSSTGKIEVMLSATAGNAITSNNDGLYVNSNSFVPSSGYVAVADPTGHTNEILTTLDGINTSWRTATPEPPTTQGVYHLVVDAQGVATWINDNRLVLGPAV